MTEINNQTLSLAKKLLKVQRNIQAVTKSSVNPYFNSRYADLNEVLGVVKPALNDEGIFLSQPPGKDEYGQFVITSLINADDDQQISGKTYFSGSEDNMQKVGTSVTYARRIGLVSLMALETEDDDGETAVGRGYSKKTEPSAKQQGPQTSQKPPVEADKRSVVPPVPSVAADPRGKLLDKISLTSKVIISSKRATKEDVVKMLTAYGVKDKAELNDEQAARLLTQLEERLK